MVKRFGYAGKILRVNLSSKQMTTEPLKSEAAEKYLGGKCLGAEILYRELRPGIDPLGLENKLIILTGPLQGTPIPGSGRFAVVCKSPETGGYSEFHAGGTFGPVLKFAGYDAIIVEGQSEGPVCLEVVDDEVDILDASGLWGRDVYETEKAIRKGRRARTSILSIGPAGERLVRFACILNNMSRALGRAGMGAVMGSKRLKAIAVTGTGRVNLHDEKGLKEYVGAVVSRIMQLPPMIDRQKYGTAAFTAILNTLGILPTKNFQRGHYAEADKIDDHTMAETILAGREACYACPIACGRRVEVKEGPFARVHPEMGGPEYETCASFGSLLMNSNLASVAKANELCNRYGMDMIATGVVIAYAMECYDREILRTAETDGIDLTWGNADAIVKLVRKIGERDGIGNVLAEGVKRAYERIGKGSEQFAMHIKGLEVPLHKPRGKKGVGLCYAVSNVGARHLEAEHDTSFEKKNAAPDIGVTEPISRFSTEGQASLVKKTQEYWASLDSLILCKFVSPIRAMTFQEVVDATRLTTGWDITLNDLMAIGERAITIGRAFNVREGFTRKDDRLPARFYQPLVEGASAGAVFTPTEFEKMLDEYYIARGWDVKTGRPTGEKLDELGLEWIHEDLGNRGLLP